MSNDKEFNGVFSWIRPDGKENYIEFRSVPVRLGGHMYVYGINRDITQRIKALKALEESELRFRQVMENIDEVFWLYEKDRMLYVSPAYDKIWGEPAQGLYEKPLSFLDVVHPSDYDRVQCAFAKTWVIRQMVIWILNSVLFVMMVMMRWIWARNFPIYD